MLSRELCNTATEYQNCIKYSSSKYKYLRFKYQYQYLGCQLDKTDDDCSIICVAHSILNHLLPSLRSVDNIIIIMLY